MNRNRMNRRDALRLGAAGAVTLALGAEAGKAFGAAANAPASETPASDGRSPVVIADLGRCLPQSALADHLEAGKWRRIPYEAGPYKGVLLWSPGDNAPAAVTVPLRAKGWHRVYAGLFSSAGAPVTLFRPTKEPVFVSRKGTVTGRVEEVPVGVWDLTGQDLEIGQRTGGARPPAGIAYVRLEPISEEQGKAESAQGHGLTVTIDGMGIVMDDDPRSSAELRQEIWYYRQSDIDTIILQGGGGADTVNYPTKFGQKIGAGQTLFPHPDYRRQAASNAFLAKKGINPVQDLTTAAHESGIDVLFGFRPAAWDLPGGHRDLFLSRFYEAHPEWRTCDRDGTAVPRLSFAVSEVRRYCVDMVREGVQFGADGACVLFNRGTPLVLFEKQFSEPFQAKYGVDPGAIADDDPRVLKERAAYVGAFMRELRAMLDDEEKRRGDGKRLKLSAIALNDEPNNVYFGIDLRAWINAGLIDSLVAWSGQTAPGRKGKNAIDLAFYREICAPKNIPFRPAIIGWHMDQDPKKNAENFAAQYAAGAGGLTYWDAASITDQRLWQPLKRFGSAERVQAFLQTAPPERVLYSMTMLDGVVMNGRFGPSQGF